MRVFHLIAAMALAAPSVAFTQSMPAAAPATAAEKATFSTTDSELGVLLDNADTKAVLMKHIPAMISNDQIAMARSMTLRSLQQYAGDVLTDATLAVIDADLAKVQASK